MSNRDHWQREMVLSMGTGVMSTEQRQQRNKQQRSIGSASDEQRSRKTAEIPCGYRRREPVSEPQDDLKIEKKNKCNVGWVRMIKKTATDIISC